MIQQREREIMERQAEIQDLQHQLNMNQESKKVKSEVGPRSCVPQVINVEQEIDSDDENLVQLLQPPTCHQ
jgi:hypothetical protein